MNNSWTKKEVKEVVHSYFKMLAFELKGDRYNKAAFRRELKPLLDNRTDGSIEFKHQNVSAILVKYKIPYVIGYKPMWNYQSLLEGEVLKYISLNPELSIQFENFSNKSVEKTDLENIQFNKLEVAPPNGSTLKDFNFEYKPKIGKINYLKKEQVNRNIGNTGEEIALNYEKWRLKNIRKENLIDKIEWTSSDFGDGFGYDIRSFNEDGSDRFIEVKTTKLGKEAPIFFSRNELLFSRKNVEQFYLYRIFELGINAKLFIKNGSLDEVCKMEPTSFIGRF